MKLIQRIRELEEQFSSLRLPDELFSARLLVEKLSKDGIKFLQKRGNTIVFEAVMPYKWLPDVSGSLDTPTYSKARIILEQLEGMAQKYDTRVLRTASGFVINAPTKVEIAKVTSVDIAKVHPNYLVLDRAAAKYRGRLDTDEKLDEFLGRVAKIAYITRRKA